MLERLWTRVVVRRWLHPCSKGGQALLRRAVKPAAQPVRHGKGVPACCQHIFNHFCSPKSSSGLLQCNGCQEPGASLVNALCPEGPQCVVRGSESVPGMAPGHLGQSAAAAWVKRRTMGQDFPWRCTPTQLGKGDTATRQTGHVYLQVQGLT